METWLSYVGKLNESQVVTSPDLLGQLFSVDLTSPQVASIQRSLVGQSVASIEIAVDNARILPTFNRFNSIVKNYLLFCKNINPQNPRRCFDLYGNLFVSLQNVYADQRGCCLNVVLRNVINEIYSLLNNSDLQSDKTNSFEYFEWFAAGLLRLFNAVRSEREPVPIDAPSKKNNVLFYACMISRAYFKSNQFVSAGNVFSNMHSVGVKLAQFPACQQVEYRFWLGRYMLYLEDVNLAFLHLDWAYQHCLDNTFQKLLILDWLVVPSILVGRLPTSLVISQLNEHAQTIITQLIDWLKSGKLSKNYADIINNNPWIQARHLGPLLLLKLPLLVYRRGLKRLQLILNSSKIRLDDASLAFNLDASIDPDLVITEGICDALICNDYMKGKILPATQSVVLRITDCFPNTLTVSGPKRSLPRRDHWMS
ncbi:Thp1 protein [Starmerella bacillaris]|uniref:Thp1 protein n=1 Tax=Starmerella bacillaris TaxID=1247836 RepID=A0AAV5RCL6_STABA|nr:Thp1 protein [Starmerella bacillaris]